MSALSQGRNNNSQELGGKPPSCKGNQSPPPLSCSVYGHREMDFICTFWVAEGGRAVGGTSSPWPRPQEGLECLGRENPRSMCWLGVRVIVKRWAMLSQTWLRFLFAWSWFCQHPFGNGFTIQLLNEVGKSFSPACVGFFICKMRSLDWTGSRPEFKVSACSVTDKLCEPAAVPYIQASVSSLKFSAEYGQGRL